MVEVNKAVIYECMQKEIHPLIPKIIEICNKYDVNPYIIFAIFKFEYSKHPRLLELNNLGNIRTEESDFMLPVEFDSMEVGLERSIRLMRQAIERNEIKDFEDMKKLIRPFEPEWGDVTSSYYEQMILMSRGEGEKYNEFKR